MNNPLPHPPAERFAGVVRTLQQALAVQGIGGRLVGPLLILVWNRLSLYVRRVAALAARAADGTLHPPAPSRPRRSAPAASHRPAPAGPAAPPRPPALQIPRGFAWLLRIAPSVASGRLQLRDLLAEPDMVALIAAAPQMRRYLRPLCRMLGIRPLPAVLVPPKAPPPADAAPAPRPKRAASRPSPRPGAPGAAPSRPRRTAACRPAVPIPPPRGSPRPA